MKERGETVAETDFVHKFSLSAKRKIPARAGRVSSMKFLIDCSEGKRVCHVNSDYSQRGNYL